MTTAELEARYLSLRCWLQRCVLPSAAVLVFALLAARAITERENLLNQNAAILSFSLLYFVLVRGGHILMIRSMHKELLKKYEPHYRARLAELPKVKSRRRNIGFTLARIKRELINELGV
jgi:hypothetical protein